MKNVKKFLPFVTVVLAALAVIMFFLPFFNNEVTTVVLGQKNGTAFALNGFQLAFGGKEVAVDVTTFLNGKGSVNSVKFDIKAVALVLIAFIALIVALIATAINLALKTKFAGIIRFVVIGLLVVAAVMMFLTVVGYNATNEVAENAQKYNSLGVGAIIGGILAILGAASEGAQIVLK